MMDLHSAICLLIEDIDRFRKGGSRQGPVGWSKSEHGRRFGIASGGP
jgi:hypothetical protein